MYLKYMVASGRRYAPLQVLAVERWAMSWGNQELWRRACRGRRGGCCWTPMVLPGQRTWKKGGIQLMGLSDRLLL